MSFLLSAGARATRRDAVAGPLAPLADSLEADLRRAMQRGVEVPRIKAMLSRDGGHCPVDGSALAFDPYEPHEHRCPTCGLTVRGERHDRWWVAWYQLWLAERAVHAAALYGVRGDPALARFATDILRAYSDRYLDYPNRDNVLGPTRPFFSTYLESIWLLQLGIALHLLEECGAEADAEGTIRSRVIEPSALVIASYDEGASNRQVWNSAALLTASLLLDRPDDAERAVRGPSGVESHLRDGLLRDGSWYEGENYHFFAHRGLWYGVTIAEAAGLSVPAPLVQRFEEGFATPLLTALPDFTAPSRRDSPYAVSLRQWRVAESCELGLARHDDARLVGALRELYRDDIPRGDTGRWRSTAEAERNEPATALSRADLGWRSLLFARTALPPLASAALRSALLDGQGYAVLRRDEGRAYVALDYGHSGGGHGHPDRLNLVLAHGSRRWLDDVGTGSYVEPTLHWYRSTLAHNAPLVDGRSQQRCDGRLRAWDDRGEVGWVEAHVPRDAIAPGVAAERSVVAMADYVVEQLRWTSDRDVSLDLPFHGLASVAEAAGWRAAALVGGAGEEDGFDWVRDAVVLPMPAHRAIALEPAGDPSARAWLITDADAELWRATAPGPPGGGSHEFLLVRMRGRCGRCASVWSWGGKVTGVEARPDGLTIAHADGSVHRHGRTDSGWHIEMRGREGGSALDLGGLLVEPGQTRPPSAEPTHAVLTLARVAQGSDLRELPGATLGGESYRRSEESWEEAGRPSATVRVAVRGDDLAIRVDVRKAELAFRPADASDPALDNEQPDIHSDGIQLYLQGPGWSDPAAWLAVPEERGGALRVRCVAGSRTGVPLRGSWERTRDGYVVHFEIPLVSFGDEKEPTFGLDLIVNDMSPERTRRRGQLVLSGGAGEYVYLRGDRQPPGRFLRFSVRRE